ncbi:hypothetical protein NBRC110019_01000 [Neptunitalea chrysea]|uniref:histidine kinase n=1 Tax=Neptunitalea chrysea TaxID=1647581 RepID=A0A9W6B2E4_9FLAO|nr:hypothetical protein NBRC110019_01000 [Neptunitalea chrysea]
MALILALWLFLYLRTDKETNKVSVFSIKLSKTQNRFSENFINYQNFILAGYKDPSFYTRNTQPNIDTYLNNLQINQKALSYLKGDSKNLSIAIQDSIKTANNNYQKLITLAWDTRKAIQLRGFKDYGTEGSMREAAHKIERLDVIPKDVILQLRRHEKDFMLRGEHIYQERFNFLITEIEKQFKNDAQTLELLNTYHTTFNEYVEKSNLLGFYNETGLINDVKKLHDQINNNLVNIKSITADKMMQLNKTNSNYLIIQTIFIGIIAIFASTYLVKTLTHDIKLINDRFRYYIQNDFLNNPNNSLPAPKFKLSAIEIRRLFSNFQLMKETLNKTIVRLNEEKEKADRNVHYKARFLANMSHEIRTPLNGIIGMLQIIEMEPLSDEQKKNIQLANYSANHLLELVNMILDYSKLEEGKMTIENNTFQLNSVFKNIEGIFKHQVKEKNIAFKTKIDKSIPKQLKGDVLRLQQVLLNIVSNAIKFTHIGSVSLVVKKVAKTDTHTVVRFTVKDTGIGIEKDQQKRLFEAFVQNDISTTRKYGGTGLGLTISNELVQLMGGTLHLESTPNQGTKFYFELSFEVAHIPTSLTHTTANNTKLDKLKGNRILIAEDNKINQMVLQRMLSKLQVAYTITHNGKEALDEYLSNDYELMLMDIQMPLLNGIEATKQIKATQKYKDTPIPIIAVTASAFEEDRKLAFTEGLDDFLTKPVIFEKLQILLEQYLGE